ncbi:copper resistance CopC family protein [Citricoccus nitrophenolicus]|uniref:copper resistance CopC family protein n=1 Tax=Citricoccus nitrophenolicus TaxID=863575 RepID=UPI0031F144AC
MTMQRNTFQNTLPTRTSPACRAPWAGAAALTAAGLLTLATAAPAAAHDQLLSATPEAGTAAIEAPSQLNLTFSGNLITGEGITNAATVTDENGHQWQDGESAVSGPELSAELCEGMPNGEYQVSYRVVYSDGHSEEKSYDFTLEDPSAPEQAVPEDCGVVNPDAPVSSDATATDPATTADDTQESGEATSQDSQDPAPAVPGWAWVAAIGGLLVVVVAVIMVFRKAKGIDAGPGADQR